MTEFNYCCKSLKQIAEKYPKTIDPHPMIVTMRTGFEHPTHPILRLYPKTKAGNIGQKDATWSELYYCPFCGTHLVNHRVMGKLKDSDGWVVIINDEHHEFETEQLAQEYYNSISLVIDRKEVVS